MDEQKKHAILFAATILAARRLADCDTIRTPQTAAIIADAIAKAKYLLELVERQLD